MSCVHSECHTTSVIESFPGSLCTPSSSSCNPPTSTSASAVKGSLLKDLGLSRIDMTPRKMGFYKEFCKKKKEIRRLKKVLSVGRKKNRQSLLEAQEKVIDNMKATFSPASFALISSVVNEVRKLPLGRRWPLESKLVAPSLLKKGPRAYSHLRSLFSLPSKSTLLPLLNAVPFKTGVNLEVMGQLRESVANFKDEDKVCSLMFDEMSLRGHLTYCAKTDQISGYVDRGSRDRIHVVARQALVFLVRSVPGHWKQPVAYYFSEAATHSEALKEIIEDILLAFKSTGLKVFATVCDMGRNNVRALQLLGATSSEPFFHYDGDVIYTIFDPPHLLKCFRNLFLKYDILVNVLLGGTLVPLKGSWSHILALAKESAMASPFDPVARLTKRHLNPNGFQKMRVSYAAQVYSRTVGSGIETMVAKAMNAA